VQHYYRPCPTSPTSSPLIHRHARLAFVSPFSIGNPCHQHELTLNAKQRKYVLTEKLLTIPSKLEVIRQIALGLHEMHQHGLVHGDVKPQNVVLKKGRVAAEKRKRAKSITGDGKVQRMNRASIKKLAMKMKEENQVAHRSSMVYFSIIPEGGEREGGGGGGGARFFLPSLFVLEFNKRIY
jgi:hypothetical protein